MALTNVPLTGQSLGQTRVPIQQNFLTIGAAFAIDHVDYNTAGQGKHNKVTLPVQAADPVLAGNDIALYSKSNGATSELFFMRGITPAYSWTDSLQATAGWTRLPSGILLKWDVSTGGPGLTTYTFPLGANIPAFTNIFQIILTTAYNNIAGGDGFIRLNSFVAPWEQFSVYGSERTTLNPKQVGFNYLAIGV